MLTFQLNTHSSTPLYEQIYQEIQRRIIDGSLPAATKLPSTRSLSANLGVSRNTVDTAYYQLQAEGYIDSAPKSGFYVCDIDPVDYIKQTGNLPETALDRAVSRQRYQQKSAPVPSLQSDAETGCRYDFSPYAIDISHFPYSVWRKLSKQILMDGQDLFLLGDNQGDFPLRAAICDYVRLSREVWCRPEQIILGAGVDYLLQMLSLTFQAHSLTQITLENPGYMQAAHIFQNNSLQVSPGILDDRGLTIRSIAPESSLVYVTPSHQYPLGAVMSFGRRKELLDWANSAPNRYIIEDDHDSEFRYKGKPIPSLQGMDQQQRVIYIGTFSKAIAPAIRVGYMILPEPLLDTYHQVCGHYSCTVSRIDQAILARFLSEGYFEKHVNRMRKIYRSKHDLALECLHPLIRQYRLGIRGEHAGLHLVLTLPENGIDEDSLIRNAKAAGIRLYGIKNHYLPTACGVSGSAAETGPAAENASNTENVTDAGQQPGILLGYSNLSGEEIEKGIRRMADADIFSV